MAEIKPFRGIRYAWEDLSTEEMGQLVAPPYDVIGAEEQEVLYKRHPANIVRLDLNRIQRTDNGEDNRYERARRHLFDWIAQGTLVVDRKPRIYVHEQQFQDEQGRGYVRRGFVALTRLADYEERIVLPHERTLRGPKVDRLELMKATECNLSQIFFLYDDPDARLDEILFEEAVLDREPQLDISTDDGIRHRLWSVSSEKRHQAVASVLADRPLLIADGHHRYETALAYRNFRRGIAEGPEPEAPYEFVMGFFVNIHDPGLQVFPTHRVVHSVQGFDFEDLRSRLQAHDEFSVEVLQDSVVADFDRLRQKLAEAGSERPAFVMIGGEGNQGFLTQYIGEDGVSSAEKTDQDALHRLDVTILHDEILERILGIDRSAQRDLKNLGYVKNLRQARQALDEESTQMVILMNPTPVTRVNEVCLSGGKMPQKSTYFFPKILSGLVINPL